MKTSQAIAVTLLLAAALAPGMGRTAESEPQHVEVAGALDAEWASYRYAYEAASFIGKFLRKRPLIQAQMQLRPVDPATPVTGLKVRLVGKTTDIELAADDIGLVTVPQLKQAYDEDAVLRLNRPKGLYKFSGRYTIKARDDGRYSVADLRDACEQMIGAQRESGYRIRLWGKKCVGVKFVYPAGDTAAALDFHAADDRVTPIGATDGKPFEDDSMGDYKIVVVRFEDWPKGGRIVAGMKPLAIGTVYE
ncbi:hypothetical protein [Scleromatobacter humisilvae]|uniref:Uncharacterized protein n=1 Tax=Scleromatobacter humisilvae TaxID=2897159 RepID=A0A9X2C089_9BURK|nr:hypothetical protein [Scleromatobacter humisilvae]MCK9684424.1 hypothetical protein [Scleromatobacter humisilvae]